MSSIFWSNIRLSGNNEIFDYKKIKKSNFYRNKNVFKVDDIDTNKILVWRLESNAK